MAGNSAPYLRYDANLQALEAGPNLKTRGNLTVDGNMVLTGAVVDGTTDMWLGASDITTGFTMPMVNKPLAKAEWHATRIRDSVIVHFTISTAVYPAVNVGATLQPNVDLVSINLRTLVSRDNHGLLPANSTVVNAPPETVLFAGEGGANIPLPVTYTVTGTTVHIKLATFLQELITNVNAAQFALATASGQIWYQSLQD